MERERNRFLPHTADGKFHACGQTLEEAFGNAALATASLMWDWSSVEPKVRHFVHATGLDREQLLVKFLGEVIYLAGCSTRSAVRRRRPGSSWARRRT